MSVPDVKRGWVRLYRSELDGPVFDSDALWRLWTWCLMRASHKPRPVAVNTGPGEMFADLQPGQFIFGRNKAARALGWPAKTCEDRLKQLEKLGKIARHPTTHFTIVSVCHWESYNGPTETDRQPSRPATAQQPPSNRHIQEWREC